MRATTTRVTLMLISHRYLWDTMKHDPWLEDIDNINNKKSWTEDDVGTMYIGKTDFYDK